MRWYRHWGKRLFDLAAAAAALAILSPVLLCLALLVRVKLGAPVLFRQTRTGWHGAPFAIYKFRTMTNARDTQGNLLPDADRLTKLGRFMRHSSLDELPELINVLKGEMSLVGPRPLLPRYDPFYLEAELSRFQARPGITGLAQVSGRNDLTWDLRLAADVQYVREYSLRLDMRILALTISGVIMRHGLQVDPASTMLDFDQERRKRKTDVNSSR